MRTQPDRLYHFTCAHARPLIDAAGVLRPWPDAAARRQHPRALADWPLPVGLVWLTDLDAPLADALGLTAEIIGCDRTAFRYTVTDLTHCQPWTVYARTLPTGDRLTVETASAGLLPAHWWVSPRVVPVVTVGADLRAPATSR